MSDKYIRTNFLDKEITKSGKSEYDMLSLNFDLLNITRPVYAYTCTWDDIGRPDRISRHIYKNDQQYWWIILRYNNICDAFNEIYPEKLLYAPNELDIRDWFLKVNQIK